MTSLNNFFCPDYLRIFLSNFQKTHLYSKPKENFRFSFLHLTPSLLWRQLLSIMDCGLTSDGAHMLLYCMIFTLVPLLCILNTNISHGVRTVNWDRTYISSLWTLWVVVFNLTRSKWALTLLGQMLRGSTMFCCNNVSANDFFLYFSLRNKNLTTVQVNRWRVKRNRFRTWLDNHTETFPKPLSMYTEEDWSPSVYKLHIQNHPM